MKGAKSLTGRPLALLVAVFLLVVLVPVPSLVKAAPVENSTFQGTTFVNEHFVMEIGTNGATLTDVYTGQPLLANLDWKVEEKLGDSWVLLDWSSGPNLTQGSDGDNGEIHRVAVTGIMANRLAVSIFYDGLPTDIPETGPKMTVRIETLEPAGTFRVLWSFHDFSPPTVQVEKREGANRTLIRGPIDLPATLFHGTSGENSFVALRQGSIAFGANWQDLLEVYQGILMSKTGGKARLDVIFGDLHLADGQAYTLAVPIPEGGGGGGGGGGGSCYMDVYGASVTDLYEEWNDPYPNGDRVKLTWSSNYAGSTNVDYRINDPTYGTGPWYYYSDSTATTSHTVYLNGLKDSRRWEFKMWSSSSSCGSDSYTRYHTTERTDLTPNSEGPLERYQADAWYYGIYCGFWFEDRKIQYHWKAAAPGEIIYSSADRTPFYLTTRLEAYGEDYCASWIGHTALKQSNITIYVRDLTDGGSDFFSGVDVAWKAEQIGNANQITWSASLGASSHGGSFGIGVGIDPDSGPEIKLNPSMKTLVNGWYWVGYFFTGWPGSKNVILELNWRLDVIRQYALNHNEHDVQVKIVFDLIFDGRSSCCGWEPDFPDIHVIKTIILGDGYPYDVDGGDFDYRFDVLPGEVTRHS